MEKKKKRVCYKCEKRTVEPNCHMACKDHIDEIAEKRADNAARNRSLNSMALKYGNSNCTIARTKGKW